jgi:hypothetical protein
VTSACKPRKRSTEPEEVRCQAASLSPEMSIVVDSRITAQCKLGSQSRRRGASGRQQSYPRSGQWAGLHRGLRRAGHGVRGETRELGRATCLLVNTTGRRGVPVDQEPWRWQGAPRGQRTAVRDTKGGSRQGIGERATSEATREGQRAVVAEHSTDEGGEVRPKRPTRGKARPGRARAWADRREGHRAYQPSQQMSSHRRGVAQLCASGRDELAGYPDRHHGRDTDEPDELIAHVRDCGGAGRVTAGSTRHRIAARWRLWKSRMAACGPLAVRLGVRWLE